MKSLLKIALIVTLICFSSASSKAQVTVVPGVDAGLPMSVSNFRSNATGSDTVGAMVRVWYRNHYSGVRSDTAIVLSPAAGQGIAEGGVNPCTGGPLWRLSITVIRRPLPGCLKDFQQAVRFCLKSHGFK